MDSELHDITLVYDQEESTSTPENVGDCALSGDEEAEPILPSPKKRKGAKRRVISVPIDGGDESSRSKGEVYPPPDSWSWRKYGQKPIKGSPYPRAYYRCSSSKGCPAKKQIERSCMDPTMLVITYTHDHNHLLPTTATKHHHRVSASAATKTSPTTTSTATTDIIPAKLEFALLANQQDMESGNSGFSDLTVDLGWFSDAGSTSMIQSSTLFGPKWVDADIAFMLPIGEEDQSLFGDLGELPECSVVFRRQYSAETPCYGGT